jgi:hypothetical protein
MEGQVPRAPWGKSEGPKSEIRSKPEARSPKTGRIEAVGRVKLPCRLCVLLSSRAGLGPSPGRIPTMNRGAVFCRPPGWSQGPPRNPPRWAWLIRVPRRLRRGQQPVQGGKRRFQFRVAPATRSCSARGAPKGGAGRRLGVSWRQRLTRIKPRWAWLIRTPRRLRRDQQPVQGGKRRFQFRVAPATRSCSARGAPRRLRTLRAHPRNPIPLHDGLAGRLRLWLNVP